MSYTKLMRFGTVDLPVYRPDTDAGTAPSRSQITRSAGGGFFDADGAAIANADYPYTLRYRCAVSETTDAAMHTTLAALRSLRGRRDKLWRVHLDSGAYEYAWARLLELLIDRRAEHFLWQPVGLEFQVLSEWRGIAHGAGWLLDSGFYFDTGLYLDTGDTAFILETSPLTITLPNAGTGGTAVHAVKITLTASSTAPITALTINNLTTLCKFAWLGTLSPDKALEIDCSALTVTNDGADAFSGFELDATNHRNSWWLELAPGDNVVEITLTGGGTDSEITFDYEEGWE